MCVRERERERGRGGGGGGGGEEEAKTGSFCINPSLVVRNTSSILRYV